MPFMIKQEEEEEEQEEQEEQEQEEVTCIYGRGFTLGLLVFG